MTTKDSPLHLKCPFDCKTMDKKSLAFHLFFKHDEEDVANKLAEVLSNIQKELQRLESLHLDFDRFATTQVAGQIQLLKSILDHEYYK